MPTVPHPGPGLRRLPAAIGMLALAAAATLTAAPARATSGDCSQTSIGATPITDLGSGFYNGYQGGLYPGGSNVDPPDHEAVGVDLAKAITPLAADGTPDPNGRYAFVSVGMSIAASEFKALIPEVNALPTKDPHLVLVNGAQGSTDAKQISNPNNPFWAQLDQLLLKAGVTPQQVRVAWLKQAISQPAGLSMDDYVSKLRDDLAAVLKVMHTRYPNLLLTYVSARSYGGYAVTTINPEPWAYWTGYAVKALVQSQLDGDPDLNYDPTKGPVKSPWIAWGPYFWADGLVPRSDGLIWTCQDFQPDGAHLSASGRDKNVAAFKAQLLSDPTSRPWLIDDFAPAAIAITSGPANLSTSADAAFSFTVDDPEAGLTCVLDGGAPRSCNQGTTSYSGLADGPHAFTVTATRPSGTQSSASWSWTIDRTAPSLVPGTLRAIDNNGNGKIDRVLMTFDEQLGAYTAGTAPWSLQNVPSGGTLSSVTISGSSVTLVVAEGSGAPDTAVGGLTVSLAPNAAGIRDKAGNFSSFAATTPSDAAAPIPLSIADGNGATDGLIEAGDTFSVTFSEPLGPGSVPGTVTVTEADPAGAGSDTVAISGVTAGSLDTGSDRYVHDDGTAASFDSTASLSPDGRTVVVTVGPVCAGTGCGSLAVGDARTFTYRPPASLTDPAANPAAGKLVVASYRFL